MHLITISVDREEWICSLMPNPDLANREEGDVLSMYTRNPDKYMA